METRLQIASRILAGLVSSSKGLDYTRQTAEQLKIDPFVAAARTALRFTDALIAEVVKEATDAN